MLIEDLYRETDAFLGGECVHVAADGVDLARNFLSAAVLGPFEYHVLEEMGDAVPFGVLVARACLQPDADRCGANMLHLFGDHGQAVGQLLTTNVTEFFGHCFRSGTA